MGKKISPLAPQTYPSMPAITGVSLGAIEAGIKYRNRKDLAVIWFDKPVQAAGVFTKSLCASAPVDWCRDQIERGTARAVVINSGNANAFTGKKGRETVQITAESAASVFDCSPEEVLLASTGVIGEPLDASGFHDHLLRLKEGMVEDGWADAASAIMTTDTFPKMATRTFEAGGASYTVNGIAKGSGMIQPDLATMLAFLATDFPVKAADLKAMLADAVEPTFNSITVDSDTSTSDTVLLFSTGDPEKSQEDSVPIFAAALKEVLHELAMYIVRDGEGAKKWIEVTVSGAASDTSAKRIAFSIANSPLVKTAIAGEDANWGRIVMAVGKAGEPADRDKLEIYFDRVRVATAGERDAGYSEAAATEVVARDFVPIRVELGIGTGNATVWTCDLTHDYIAINADYRS